MLIDAHLHLDKYGDLLDEALKQIETERIFTVATAMEGKSGRCCLSGIVFLQMLRTDPRRGSYSCQSTTSDHCPSDDEHYPRSRYTNTNHDFRGNPRYLGVRRK